MNEANLERKGGGPKGMKCVSFKTVKGGKRRCAKFRKK